MRLAKPEWLHADWLHAGDVYILLLVAFAVLMFARSAILERRAAAAAKAAAKA